MRLGHVMNAKVACVIGSIGNFMKRLYYYLYRKTVLIAVDLVTIYMKPTTTTPLDTPECTVLVC